MQKITIVVLLLIFIGIPATYAAGNFAYNRLGTAVTIVSPLEANGAIPVNVQDQTTIPIDISVYQVINNSMSLNQTMIINQYDLILNPGHGVMVGDNIIFQEEEGVPEILFGEVLGVSVNTITMDSLIPFAFVPNKTSVATFTNELAVNGAVTEQVFELRNFFEEPFDITRFIFHCSDSSAMDDSGYCGLSKLTRGVMLRKEQTDGNYINYWNIKSNGEWSQIAFDSKYNDKVGGGLFGFATRLTYAGQEKHGVAIRLEINESIQFIIQDDLTGLSSMNLMVEGHFIQN